MKVVLITGASSGIGFTTARSLAEQGHKVYGAARRVEKMEELKQFGVTPIKMDVTSEESVNEAVEQVIAAEKRIDVLVNNAGYGSYGAVEDVSIDEHAVSSRSSRRLSPRPSTPAAPRPSTSSASWPSRWSGCTPSCPPAGSTTS